MKITNEAYHYLVHNVHDQAQCFIDVDDKEIKLLIGDNTTVSNVEYLSCQLVLDFHFKLNFSVSMESNGE